MIELLTISPIVFRIFVDNSISTVYAVTIVMRLYRIVRYVQKLYQKGRDEVQRQIFTIILTIGTLITISAALIQAVENPYRLDLIETKK